MITNETDGLTNLQKLRELIQDLTYTEMMILAQWFADMDKTEEESGEASFWAYVINQWAQNAELPEDEE
ncbi:hypothetical protein [Rhizobium sp.]|uniref:hypothetical protein n=1 Tax=Rhizobium sp. TaxID=391 RepID=UPI003F7E83E2